MKKVAIFFLLITGVIGSSCSQTKTAAVKSPPDYDLTKPIKYAMPAKLLEISGIAFNNGDNKLIYAEQDEDGIIYSFRPGEKQIKQVQFGKHGDYEDIAVLNSRLVMLRSDGKLYSMALSEVNSGAISDKKEFKDLLPPGEYESLHGDQAANKLYVLCKHCDVDKHENESSGYIFNLSTDGSITSGGNFKVNVKQIEKLTGQKQMKFHPSAIAKNPLTGQWYILSSVNKLLVVTDANWGVQQAYALNPDIFNQPEGMAFDSAGNFYISNEGGATGIGTILLFKYNGKK